MKKKILFIIPSFNYGGTVLSTLNMVCCLQNDYDVCVLPMTYQGPFLKEYKDANVTLLPEIVSVSALVGKTAKETVLSRKAVFLLYKCLNHFFKKLELYVYRRVALKIENEYKFDFIASCQEGCATYFASYFSKCEKIAWFRSEYRIYKTEVCRNALKLDQRIYPRFSKIVCVSKTTRDDFASCFPSLDDKIISIHNIQNVPQIESKANEKVLDFPRSEFVVASIGRINPQKRFSTIPGIARKLLDAGCDFKWIIIGEGNAFGEWEKLQYEINKNRVNNVVICLGGKLNPYPYIKQASLLVNTSYVEACPRVVIEAKLLKTPVICADFSSAQEFITSGINGYIDQIAKLDIHIRNMILDKKLYNRIKSKCNEYKFDCDYIYNQLKDLFHE